MENKICFQCKEKNDPSFSYCKRCGAPLPVVEEKTDLSAEVVSENNTSHFEEDTIDGVNAEHVRAFVGKNNTRIMDSFYNMSIYNKKTSFCAPVLILGLLMGFFGMSIWFFYRKMNKIGFLLLSIPLIFSCVDVALNFEVIKNFLKGYTEIFSLYMLDTEALNNQLTNLYADFAQNFVSFLPDVRNIIESIAAPIFMSVFALYFYKRHAVKKVKEICAYNKEDSNLSLKLFLSGGTSAIRTAIPFAATFALTLGLVVLLTALLI